LTEQSIFNLVANPGQNNFGTQIVPTLQSSAGPLQIDCVSSHVTSCLQQQLTFQPVRYHLQRRLPTSRCLPGLINSLSEAATQCNSKTTQLSIQQYEKRSLCVFEAAFGLLRATYAVHLRLIGKLVVDFLLVIMELFR